MIKLIIFLPIVLLISVSAYFTPHNQSDVNESCIQSFQDFAYNGPAVAFESTDIISPRAPWQAVSLNTDINVDGGSLFLNDVSIGRSKNGHSEIWISLSKMGSRISPPDSAEITGFAIYQPVSQKWEVISPYVGDTDIYISKLFVDSYGTIWGETQWSRSSHYPQIENVPVLSKFNDSTRRFEFAKGIVEIPLDQSPGFYNFTQIVLDAQDIFWIFLGNGDIYRYDSLMSTTENRGNHSSGQVIYTAVSPDGSIYFVQNNPTATELRLGDNNLFQFFPDLNKSTLVGLPDSIKNWPLYSGLLVDHDGTLWLGAVGYRDKNGEWDLIQQSYLETYANHLGQYMWASPMITFESSDGKLWYQRYLDSSGKAEGIAWYDPKTGEGCLVTNQPAAIIEDSEHRLWIVAGGILYKNAMKSQ